MNAEEQNHETETTAKQEPNRRSKRELRYNFRDQEITEIARKQGDLHRQLETVEEEKKVSAAQYKGRIDILEGEIKGCTQKITCGYEMRMVELEEFFHSPKQGMKTVVRTETGETVEIVAMTEMECQSMLPLEEPGEEPAEPEPKELAALPGEVEGEWLLIDRTHPEYAEFVMFRNGEGAQRIGRRMKTDEGDIILSIDGAQVALNTAIAWRKLTSRELEAILSAIDESDESDDEGMNSDNETESE